MKTKKEKEKPTKKEKQLDNSLQTFNIIPPASEMSEKDEVLAKCYNDLLFFGRAFLPNDFLNKSASPLCHYQISKRLISTKPGERICIILPRGFGKSILSKTAILHKLCFSGADAQNFIAWVSEEQGQSIDHLKFLRYHLETNKMIKYYFGNMDGGSVGKRWTEKDLVTPKGDRIIAKGSSQRLRGRAEVDVRYTGIMLDDFESELNTKTPDRRNDIKRWVVSTIYPALEESPGREGWIWLAGTIVHFDSFLQMTYDGFQQAKKDDRHYPWDVYFHSAIESGKSIWPEQFSLKEQFRKDKYDVLAEEKKDIPIVHKIEFADKPTIHQIQAEKVFYLRNALKEKGLEEEYQWIIELYQDHILETNGINREEE